MKEQLDTVFRKPLSLWSAALGLATANILLFAFEKPWTSADGLRNWGDWLLYTLGAPTPEELLSPLLYSGSVLNVGILAGALLSALLSDQFAVRMSTLMELAKGTVGGILMGLGAVLAMGCNIGGFVSAVSALSAAGFSMMLGLLIGAYLGLRYLVWEVDRFSRISIGSRMFLGSLSFTSRTWLVCCGLLAAGGAVAAYSQKGYSQRGVLLVFGLILGIILQRSRFCLVRAFREPFLTGESRMTQAAALSVGVSMLGFSILKSAGHRSLESFVFPAFWEGSFLGGIVFGIGMVLAGGCGVGALWRAGEGHVKLLFTTIAFALSTSIFRMLWQDSSLINHTGSMLFLPDRLGWPLSLLLALGVLLAWSLFAVWNEKARGFAA
ncbi:MAG: YeeE/YedE family protein [Acidobacteria bacterium]|nr:YeeE/YedE family protein [Acidobacteriota bacterium]